MRRVVAVLVAAALLVGLAAPAAHAGGRTAARVALGLASFAVFNQLVGPILYPRAAYYPRPVYAYPPTVVVHRPVYSYAPPPSQVVVVPAPSAPPAYQTVVQYPHGRYELRGDGVTTAYQWVWIPNAPPPPPPPPPPPAAAP